ncbi:hypothetical protein [Poseidonibacter sp.]|uniref:hypothetical protein n=1 Tax=Poseidonibacter sp. TaxID=2321188 RepID=UPI003C71367B
MIAILTSALVETLAKFIIHKTLVNLEEINIEGAPSWYMKEYSDNICTFSYAKGDLASVEIAKDEVKIKMTKRIDKLVEITVYENMSKITNEKERALVSSWKKDPNIDIFRDKNMTFSKIVYDEDLKTTFARGCIPNEEVLKYQKNRLEDIKKTLLKHKSSSAIDELEKEVSLNNNTNTYKDPFDELKKSIK